jgi:hypothetical protein
MMGLTLEDPEFHIEWRTAKSELVDSFPAERLEEVSSTYFAATCVSHKGLRCRIGFRFGRFPRQSVELLLYQLEFFRDSDSPMGLRTSFVEFQRHFEMVYGPGQIAGQSQGFPIYKWLIPGAEIRHFVSERFGPAEYLLISC